MTERERARGSLIVRSRALTRVLADTVTFPVAFILVSSIVTVVCGAGETPLLLDSLVLTFPMALLAWPANAIVVWALRRAPARRPAHWAAGSALAGMATVFAAYPFRFVMTESMWDAGKMFFPVMYWAAAAASTYAASWLLWRRRVVR